MAEVIKRVGEVINVAEMQDGQIGIITSWCIGSYEGDIVQRYGDHLICLGEETGNSWTDFFKKGEEHVGCEVEILRKGTQIEL